MDRCYDWIYQLKFFLESNDYLVVKKTKYWMCAIGLQEVDSLLPSNYLIELVKKEINNEIDVYEVLNLINFFYNNTSYNNSFYEADNVAIRFMNY